MFTQLLESYKEKGLKALSSMVKVNEEPTEDEFNKEVDIAQKKSEGKIRNKKIGNAALQAVEIDKAKAGGLDESSNELLYKERDHLRRADDAFVKGDRDAYHNFNRIARIAGKAHREMYGPVYHDLTHMSHNEAEDHLNTSRIYHDGDIINHPTYGTQIHDKDLGHVEKMNAWKDAALKKNKIKEDVDINESEEENPKKVMWGKSSSGAPLKGGRDKAITPEEKKEILDRVKKSAEEIKKKHYTMKNGKIVSEEVDLEERKLSPEELEKRENIVKKLKKKMKDFKARYGDNAKSVVYAVATKQAKK